MLCECRTYPGTVIRAFCLILSSVLVLFIFFLFHPSSCLATTHSSIAVYSAYLKIPLVTVCTTCFNSQKLLHFAHRVYLCVSYDSQNKQRVFP
jgi:hypothetical protein